MMKLPTFSLTISLIALLFISTSVSGAKSSTVNTCGVSRSKNSPSVFGVIPTITQLRGGAGSGVVEATTLEQVNDLILKAAMNNQLVVIDFTASWCGPCKFISPVFSELADSINDVVFLKVDVDENPDTASKYSVSAMPTFVFIKGGEVVDRLMGANPDRLKEMIQELAN
mmetsp:Transcript_8773/g.13585  ORF Transcript_8773/g.13585 Transcript_8773/m.13585 type:complete len:170 (+) Transcript_8773:139-648(+)